MYGFRQESVIFDYAEASWAFGDQHSSVGQESDGPGNVKAGFYNRLEFEDNFFGLDGHAGAGGVVFRMVALVGGGAFADVDDEAANFGVVEGVLQCGVAVSNAVR